MINTKKAADYKEAAQEGVMPARLARKTPRSPGKNRELDAQQAASSALNN